MLRVEELLDAVDLAVARSNNVVSPERRAGLATRTRDLRLRTGYLGETLLVAIAGGTGSGKSSLLNALAGFNVASVSHLRPHTEVPLAWIPANPDPGMLELLESLGISELVEQSTIPHVAIIDLPDMDSVAEWHRRTVEDLLPKVDAVLWVFDPEKYRDRVIHHDFLAPLSDYHEQFIFCLNKIDLLHPSDVAAVKADLERVLHDDGYHHADVFAFAAAPPDGRPRDIGVLREFLDEQLDGKRVAMTKLIADARLVLRSLADEPQTWKGPSVDFEERWARVQQASASELVPGAGPAAREDALCRVEDLVAAISVEVGPECGAAMRELMPRKRIEETIDSAIEAAANAVGPSQRGWRRVKLAGRRQAEEAAAAVLDAEVASELESLLIERARLAATIAYASVSADQILDRFNGAVGYG